MSGEQLVKLVNEIMSPEAKSEKEIDMLLDSLKANVPPLSPANLIFHTDFTPEEIVDKALAYKPIQL